jgi:hypothetical protein
MWGRRETYTGFWWRKIKGRDHMENKDAIGKIILKKFLKKWSDRSWTGFVTGTSDGCCEHDSEPPGCR